MKPRELGGAITRADAIFVWVPYAEIVYEPDEEEEEEELEEPEEPELGAPVEVSQGPDDPDPGDPEDDEPEEIGYWLAITKVQARELVADACTAEIEDLDILAEERPTGLYIGLGPLP